MPLLTDYEREVISARSWPLTPFLIDSMFLPVLVELEQNGCVFDPTGLDATKAELDEHIANAQEAVDALAGRHVNLNGGPDKARFLYGDLGLPTAKKSKKTGLPSVDKETLEALDHPVADLILDYSKHYKLRSAFVNKLPVVAEAFNGRIKYCLNNTLVKSGRLSCGGKKMGALSINIQQIPARTELGKRLRSHFAASPGRTIYAVDASQFQLRIAAVDSGDEAMIRAFHSGVEYHTQTAVDVLGEPIKPVGKTLNFAILFGAGKPKVVRTLLGFGIRNIPRARLMGAYDAYFAARPQLAARIEQVHALADTQGYVDDYFGRRHTLDFGRSEGDRQKALRLAYNSMIQGPESSIMPKIVGAMISRAIRRRQATAEQYGFPGPRADAVLAVHDEIAYDVEPGDNGGVPNPSLRAAWFEEIIQEVENELNELLRWPVPVVLSYEHGPNWADAH